MDREELGRVLINPAARCDEGYVRFAAIATKFVRQRNMSRWTRRRPRERSAIVTNDNSSWLPNCEFARSGLPNLVCVWLPREHRSESCVEIEGHSGQRVLWLSRLGHLQKGCGRLL
jgi:hypothetical protein